MGILGIVGGRGGKDEFGPRGPMCRHHGLSAFTFLCRTPRLLCTLAHLRDYHQKTSVAVPSQHKDLPFYLFISIFIIMAAHLSKFFDSRDFFATHPVFTHAEYVAAHTMSGRSENTSNSLLANHVANGHLVRVRRGIYATVPPGVEPQEFNPDPYLIAAHLREDAVVSHHSALAFHGKVYAIRQQTQYTTSDRARPFYYRGQEFTAVQAPKVVRSLPDFGGGVMTRPHAGANVRVTTLERCLVDLLHSPEHGGDWEEIWRSLEMVEFFNLDAVFKYARLMGSALTMARVGFFLEQHRDELMVEESYLEKFGPYIPAQPRYLDSSRESGRLLSRWNLVVPDYVLNRRWDEFS